MITLKLKRTEKNRGNQVVDDFIPDVGEPFLMESDINSFSTIATDNAHTRADVQNKQVYLDESYWSLFKYDIIDGKRYPKVGQTLFIDFEKGNELNNINLVVYADAIFGTEPLPIAYKNGNEYEYNIHI